VECFYYGMRIHEDSEMSSFKPILIENWYMCIVHLRNLNLFLKNYKNDFTDFLV